MTLNFTGFTSTPEGMTTTGRRGTYKIRWVTGMYILTGVGHDDLPMSGMSPWGRKFESSSEAQLFAGWLELAQAESEVSGA